MLPPFFFGSKFFPISSVTTISLPHAKIQADKAAERAAEAAKQKAMEEEQSARRAAQAESVQAARRETSRPRALWERYYTAINANGTMCEQYKFVIKNWHEAGFDENVLINWPQAFLPRHGKLAACNRFSVTATARASGSRPSTDSRMEMVN